MKKEAIITLDAITVRLRDKAYLQNTSWQIKSNENWAVLGPNGAGKTTLAKSLFGGVPVVGGRITHHYDTKDSESIYHSIGYVSPEQQRGIMEKEDLQLDSRDSIGLYRLCSNEQKDLARAWIDTLGIAYLADQNFGQLSHGQCLLVLIVRAMVKSPVSQQSPKVFIPEATINPSLFSLP